MTTLKMAVFTPIPRPRVTTKAAEYERLLYKLRSVCLISITRFDIFPPPPSLSNVLVAPDPP